jgi:hypothetical protein
MAEKILVAVVFACAVFGGRQARADDYVQGYYRSNGTYVAPYYRTHADHNFYNNYRTYPNINPYTGQIGTRLTPHYSSSMSFPSYHHSSYSVPSYGYSSYSNHYGWRR